MKTAEIYATAAGEGSGYIWYWRCRESKVTSAKGFPLYFECVVDAREQGYEVELTHARGTSAPGGAGYALDRGTGSKPQQ
jgi:hypothetical protein